MDLDEARAGMGRKVIYSPFAEPDFDDETGVITGVSDRHAFVAYGGQQQSKATNPGDLRFADEGTGAHPEVTPEFREQVTTLMDRNDGLMRRLAGTEDVSGD